MRNNFIATLLFLFISLSALVLRTYNIANNPPSLQWDEVSIGYNAYSILKTGRDEHGRFLPFDAFVAYGDYKPPLAIYMTVPFVAAFGLSELAVRLPAALFSTATVILTYFLVLELLRKRKDLATLTMFVLAVSPWSVNLARGGFEANIAWFFGVLWIWLFLSARSHPKRWFWVWLPMVAAIYTFNSTRIFAPLFAPALVIYAWKDVKKNFRAFITGGVIGLIVLAPIVPHLMSPQARLRFTEVNIFTDISVIDTSNARIAREPMSIIGKLVNNRRVGYTYGFLLHFFDNMRPRFLFLTGDGNPKFSIQDIGEMYFIEAPFFAVGILALCLFDWNVGMLLIWWMIAAIIPAATARETPHALRILNSLPTWHIFVAFGIFSVVSYASSVSRRKLLRNLVVLCIIGLYAYSIVYYIHTYHRHYPAEYSSEWQYGYKSAITDIAPIADKYGRVMITDSIGRSYMYTLFYTKTDPRDFWRTKKDYFDAAGFYHVDGFGKYEFGGKLPSALDPKTLYVWDTGGVPKGARVLDAIRRLDGTPVLTIFDSGSVTL